MDETYGAELTGLALEMGAQDAVVIEPTEIVIKDELAVMCHEPTPCENLGLGAGCPPHVGGPAAMRGLIERASAALVFRFMVPTERLLSEQRRDVFALLQSTAALLEREALHRGASQAWGFAGGSCKAIFCSDYAVCNVVKNGGPCRYPDDARPSMSGFGVDVTALMTSVELPFERVTAQTDPAQDPASSVVGLVLIKA